MDIAKKISIFAPLVCILQNENSHHKLTTPHQLRRCASGVRTADTSPTFGAYGGNHPEGGDSAGSARNAGSLEMSQQGFAQSCGTGCGGAQGKKNQQGVSHCGQGVSGVF